MTAGTLTVTANVTCDSAKQKLTLAEERQHEEGAQAAGGQQVHPCECLRYPGSARFVWPEVRSELHLSDFSAGGYIPSETVLVLLQAVHFSLGLFSSNVACAARQLALTEALVEQVIGGAH